MSNTRSSPTQHHVYLFRHCVRSVNNKIGLHNNWTGFVNGNEIEYEVSDFLPETMPDWNTPEVWCTNDAIDILRGTGHFLWDEILDSIDPQDRPPRIQVQLIADESQRDIDTAFALFRGLRQRSRNPDTNPRSAIVDGLSDIAIDRNLFKPWDPLEPLCSDPLFPDSQFRDLVQHEIQHRLDTIEPPDAGLKATLEEFQQVSGGGMGKLGIPLTDVPSWISGTGENFMGAPAINTTSPFPVLVSPNHTALAGPVNLVHWMAQIAYYSRAGGVDSHPYFLKDATLAQIYKWAEWIHWARTISEVENSLVASKGVVMAQAILEALEHGSVYVPGSHCPEPDTKTSHYDAKVTIIVGHDSDLDSVATAFGLSWNLHRPYHTSKGNKQGAYVPTPPGSGLHFRLDGASQDVDMSFVYPIYLKHFNVTTDDPERRVPTGMKRMSSGKLDTAPLHFQLRPKLQSDLEKNKAAKDDLGKIEIPLSKDEKRTTLPGPGWRMTGLQALSQQLAGTLDQFPTANECYQAATNQAQEARKRQEAGLDCHVVTKMDGNVAPGLPGTGSDALEGGSALPVVVFALILACGVYHVRKSFQQPRRRNTNYDEVFENSIELA